MRKLIQRAIDKNLFRLVYGQGNPRVVGAGSLWEAGEEGVGGGDIQSGRELEELGNISQHWHNISQSEKADRGCNCYERRREPECREREVGSSDPLSPPPPPPPTNALTASVRLIESVLSLCSSKAASDGKS